MGCPANRSIARLICAERGAASGLQCHHGGRSVSRCKEVAQRPRRQPRRSAARVLEGRCRGRSTS
eukprot:9035823-Pyramimonas_sp.AAC.1